MVMDDEQDQYSYSEMIISERFFTEKDARRHVETSNEYLHLLEFEKRDDVLNVVLLAISGPLLEFLYVLGESLPEQQKAIINPPSKSINKPLVDWFNRFADYLEKSDKKGATKLKKVMQNNYKASMQDKHPLPLVISVKLGTSKYLEGIMSSEFIRDGERLINLSKTEIQEISEEEYNYRLENGVTIDVHMPYEERYKRRNEKAFYDE